MAKQNARVLKGFRDFTPADMRLRLRLIETLRMVFERHGFEPIDTPVLEYLDILTGKAGENEKLMYHFADHGDREIGLRYDLTVPLARFMAMHENDVVLPFKRYHIAPVWRAEKPQRGRSREFLQCDADIVGSASMLADAECISVMADSILAVGLPQAVIHINHRGLLEALALLAGVDRQHAGGIFRAIDKLDKIGPDGVQRELETAGVGAQSAADVLSLVTQQGEPRELLRDVGARLADIDGGPDAVADLTSLADYLDALGVPAESWKIDLSLARGIDYYTGPVCEARVESPKIGSVAGAGRYDGLIGNFLGRQIPATGMSFGFERILEVVREHELMQAPEVAADIFVAWIDDTSTAASRLTRELREHGLRVDQSILANRGIGAQLKYADRKGIPLAVIPGPDELDRNVVSVKNLRSGSQAEVQLDGLAEELTRQLGSQGLAETSSTFSRSPKTP